MRNFEFFTVLSKELNQRVGMMSIHNIIHQMKTFQISSVIKNC